MARFPNRVCFYASGGGVYGGQAYSVGAARELIGANYNPNHSDPQDDIRILITTDVLAEGINLHRSNVVVNYDLPWNPTRVLQRVGRVNRVGTEHKTVYVFNFFPTSQSDEHLGLEGNIKAKLQAFHDTLGEDAKYLSNEEEVSTHELFGEKYADTLYRKLTDRDALEAEEDGVDEATELGYLKLIREVKDAQPDLFETVKRLPKKARSGKAWPQAAGGQDHLLTFFRKGKLKKFVLGRDRGEPVELTFLDAAKIVACRPETERCQVPSPYYSLLTRNKEAFKHFTSDDPVDLSGGGGGVTNEKHILQVLKSREFRHFKGFTDEDEHFLKAVREALEAGLVAKNTAKRIKTDLKNSLQPLKVLAVLRRNLDVAQFRRADAEEQLDPREVILSEYLVGSEPA